MLVRARENSHSLFVLNSFACSILFFIFLVAFVFRGRVRVDVHCVSVKFGACIVGLIGIVFKRAAREVGQESAPFLLVRENFAGSLCSL